MKKLSGIITMVAILSVLLVGCANTSAASTQNASALIPVTSSNQSQQNMGSGENVVRPIDPSLSSPNNVTMGLGSGENVVRPINNYGSSQSIVSRNGENVIPPPGTKGDDALHPSSP